MGVRIVSTVVHAEFIERVDDEIPALQLGGKQ